MPRPDIVALLGDGEDAAPEYVYFFYDADGVEVGDRVFALNAERAAMLEQAFPRLAPKRADGWARFTLVYDHAGMIERKT